MRFPAHRIVPVILFACLFFAGPIRAQNHPPAPADVDSGKVLPLNLKTGCWLLRTQTTTDAQKLADAQPKAKLPTADEMVQQAMDKMTPEQRKQFDAAYWTKFYTQYLAGLQKQSDQNPQLLANQLKNASTDWSVPCTMQPFLLANKDLYGTPQPGCTRTIRPLGASLRASVKCQGSSREYVRSDYENFVATMTTTQMMKPDAAGPTSPEVPVTNVTTWTGKWMGEMTPHMPHAVAPTGLNGEKFLGIDAVGTMDPYRIVCVIDGKQLTSYWARAFFKAVFPHWEGDPPERLTHREELHRLYMHRVIADEARQMGLDRKQPWEGLLQSGGWEAWYIDTDPDDYKANSSLDSAIQAAEYLREKILWNAYLSQASTPAAKKALEQKIEQRFQVTVIDPDFFVDTNTN